MLALLYYALLEVLRNDFNRRGRAELGARVRFISKNLGLSQCKGWIRLKLSQVLLHD